MTFGFSEVEDAARLWATHRHEMAAAMARHDEIVRAVADQHDGHVFATGGDSLGVAFHRAGEAAGWATQLQNLMAAEAWPAGAQLRLRIGLHTGETEERGKGYFGTDVIVASRLAATGHGGQVLASGVTAALLGGDNLNELGTYRLEGVAGDHRILQLGPGNFPPLRTEDTRRGNLPQRLGRLHGRDDDVAEIVNALTLTPVVTLVGPGGIGKTRLVWRPRSEPRSSWGAARGLWSWRGSPRQPMCREL